MDDKALAQNDEVTVVVDNSEDQAESTCHSDRHVTEQPFSSFWASPDSRLDPKHATFSTAEWASRLMRYASAHPQKYPLAKLGFCFRNLDVYGYGSQTDYQKTVANTLLQLGALFRRLGGVGKRRINILRGFDGVVNPGEMLLILGRPGSGCSSLLKTISGDMHGLHLENSSVLNYQGVPPKVLREQFRGEALYMAEIDVHFPQMTVAQTLLFAAKARAPPDDSFPGIKRDDFASHLSDVAMATFGLDQVAATNVGNEFIGGVSGGERKRVSIAEALLSGAPLHCWDNSTRGLDSANAIEFCKTLSLCTEAIGSTSCVALYQAPQTAYECFNKVTVLFEGRQIYFGLCKEAAAYFQDLGFEPATRQTTADFLTSVTSSERRIRPGYEQIVPNTPEEFVQQWKSSTTYAQLLADITKYDEAWPIGGSGVKELERAKRSRQAAGQRIESPYLLSYLGQVKLCAHRGFQRLRRDASITITGVIVNSIMALVVGSVFYNLDETTNSFYSRGVLLFFAILLNAFASAMEILLLYAQRPIVEKQKRYGFYQPSAEAVASIICDLPYKIGNTIFFNLVLYFMTNLRRTPSAFFTFLLFSFFTTLVMSTLFRTFGAMSRTLVQALVPSAIIILALNIFTGFVVPPTAMVPWFRWINYIDPIAYAFESLMVNEFWDRDFDCSSFVPQGPGFENVPGLSRVCRVVGARAGSRVVRGEDYLRLSFGYEKNHLWRNFGILNVFLVIFLALYLGASDIISSKRSRGEVLVFRRGHKPKEQPSKDPESLDDTSSLPHYASAPPRDGKVPSIEKHLSVFHWKDVCLDISVNKEKRRILDHVDGWIKPGTLTALMGPSGAGKTSLLDVLASRCTIGVISGDIFVDGQIRDASFQRKTGYAQQHDLHLATATVRESLQFSALLRQPVTVSRREKMDYAEEVIKLLGMQDYAEAIVGVPGEGLNVEQRKRLTIGVELAARPQLLLFLDEPTSGLDSQTAWSILDLLTTLRAHGQAVLCTIHQPSAPLLQRFDRLLLLSPNGRPAYFGDIGIHCATLTKYFESNGATPCPEAANPAEWLMEIMGCAPGSHSDQDWPSIWRKSPEFTQMRRALDTMEAQEKQKSSKDATTKNKSDYWEFAAPMSAQFWECFKRIAIQYWRSPSYIYSKTALTALEGLFIGFTFYKADNTLQGLQDQAFSIFMLLTIFPNFVPQILPNFVSQRDLYEARERPAKTYSWKIFLLSNILIELLWNTLMAVLMFLTWYYPIGFYRNAIPTNSVTSRSGTMFLLLWVFLMFTSTFAHMVQAGIETAEAAGNAASALFTFSLVFCGILVAPNALPRFWIFMYRVSPFTYLVSAVLSTALGQTAVQCSSVELLRFAPVGGTCGSYLAEYIATYGGYLVEDEALDMCEYCPVSNTDVFLESIGIYFQDRWWNFGILWAYVLFNVLAAVFLYWLARIPKAKKAKVEGKDD